MPVQPLFNPDDPPVHKFLLLSGQRKLFVCFKGLKSSLSTYSMRSLLRISGSGSRLEKPSPKIIDLVFLAWDPPSYCWVPPSSFQPNNLQAPSETLSTPLRPSLSVLSVIYHYEQLIAIPWTTYRWQGCKKKILVFICWKGSILPVCTWDKATKQGLLGAMYGRVSGLFYRSITDGWTDGRTDREREREKLVGNWAGHSYPMEKRFWELARTWSKFRKKTNEHSQEQQSNASEYSFAFELIC